MPRNLGLIIFLLFVVWQVVSAIINQVNANKQQQRAEEMARKRRQSEAGGTATADQADGRPKRSIDDLAARRKAQLEELRRRREEEKSQKSRVRSGREQANIGGVASPPSPGPATPIGSAPTSQSSSRRQPDPWQQRRQEASKAKRDAELARKAKEARTKQQDEARRRARLEREQAEALIRRHPASRPIDEPIEPIQAGAIGAESIRRCIHNRRELRRLFVLKELLDKPLALRRDES